MEIKLLAVFMQVCVHFPTEMPSCVTNVISKTPNTHFHMSNGVASCRGKKEKYKHPPLTFAILKHGLQNRILTL